MPERDHGAGRTPRRWALALFLLVVTVHAFSELRTPWDSRWALHVAYSLVTEGDADLEEWRHQLEPGEYRIEYVDGRPYTIFPLGASLWAAPFVALADGGLRLFSDHGYRDELERMSIADTQELLASIAVGLATVLSFRLYLRMGLSLAPALMLALALAFSTSAWSTASRALWSHAPSLACNAAALLLLWPDRALSRRRLVGAGLVLGLGYVTRPTNAWGVVVLTSWVLWRERGRAWPLMVGGAAVAVLFFAHGLSVYGSPLPPYYQPGRLDGESTLAVALLGNLVSPARGLLVYTPLLLLLPWGWRWGWSANRGPFGVCAAVGLGHWLAVSAFPHWWGGHCYGPRFFTDVLPFLFVPLVPVAAHASRRGAGRGLRAAVVVTALVGVVLHGIGANVHSALAWNRLPLDIDDSTERLWSWTDPPFLRWQDPPPAAAVPERVHPSDEP